MDIYVSGVNMRPESSHDLADFIFHVMTVYKKLLKHMKIWEVFDSI